MIRPAQCGGRKNHLQSADDIPLHVILHSVDRSRHSYSSLPSIKCVFDNANIVHKNSRLKETAISQAGGNGKSLSWGTSIEDGKNPLQALYFQ